MEIIDSKDLRNKMHRDDRIACEAIELQPGYAKFSLEIMSLHKNGGIVVALKFCGTIFTILHLIGFGNSRGPLEIILEKIKGHFPEEPVPKKLFDPAA